MRRLHLILLVTLAGCGSANPSAPAAPADETLLLSIASGNGQQGFIGEVLRSALFVRVTNADGVGVPSRQVVWTVADGSGEFEPHLSAGTGVSYTGSDGTAGIFYRPTASGSSTVTASVGTGIQGSPVAFAIHSIDLATTTLRLVMGNDQVGVSGGYLPDPFLVQLTTPDGAGVAYRVVEWSVAVGDGEFQSAAPFNSREGRSLTAANGMSSIRFRPLAPGPTTVVATVPGGVQGTPVTFRVNTVGMSAVLITFSPLFDCVPENDPVSFGAPQGNLNVGTIVEWRYASWLPGVCRARIVSRSLPEGATPYDSGPMAPGDEALLVLSVAGDWEFEEAFSGGKVTLRVR